MSFERSASGQANRALFYGVDWVIYTEGGADSGEPVRSYDSVFWSAIFRAIQPNLSVKAIPRGGKSELESLARRVAGEDVANVVVAMDRDYDGLFEDLLQHPRIIYTFGYSFENDIYDVESIARLFSSLAPSEISTDDLQEEVDSWLHKFMSVVRWPLKVDICAKQNNVKGFDRDRPQKYFESNAYGCEPLASRNRVVAETDRILSECRDRTFGLSKIPEMDPRSVIGHIWEVFTFRLISCLHSKYCNTSKINYDQLRSAGITLLQIRIMQGADNDNLSDYYRERVGVALG